MNELMNVEIRNTLTSLEVAQIAGKEHKNILADIRDEISKLGEERGRLIFQPTTYIDNFNRSQPMFLLNYKGVLQLAKTWRSRCRKKINVFSNIQRFERQIWSCELPWCEEKRFEKCLTVCSELDRKSRIEELRWMKKK